jgi:hypothetical protein
LGVVSTKNKGNIRKLNVGAYLLLYEIRWKLNFLYRRWIWNDGSVLNDVTILLGERALCHR